MTMDAALVNPLGLTVGWRSYIQPPHEAFDAGRLAELTASMTANGWAGPPVVADRELAEVGQDRAYTGSHRLAAWDAVHDEPGTPAPCVYIEDLCAALGIPWDSLMEGHGNDAYEAAGDLCRRVPDDVREAYGLDVGGTL